MEKSNIKLVKNSKTVKFPRETSSVQGTFKQALKKSKEQKWNKVIVIGVGPHSGHYFHSKMTDHKLMGILHDVLYLINKDHLG